MSDIPEIDELLMFDLTESIEDTIYFVDLIDSTYNEKPNNNIMRFWQSKGVNLKSVVLTDLLDWLCCLAFSDGFIAPEEVEFINTCLKQNLSVNDLIQSCMVRIDQKYFKHIPLSFILLYEEDLVIKSLGLEMPFNPVEILYSLFMIVGAQFIYCDNNVSYEELVMFNEYLEDLSKRIYDFDLIQKELTIIEMTDGKIGQKYSEERYTSSKVVLNNYLEKINEGVSDGNTTSNIFNNPWKSSGNKPNVSWDLKSNPNNYYNFTGEFDNHLANFEDIFTPENCQKLKNNFLTPQQYISILNKIKSTSDILLAKTIDENNIDINSLSIFEKILLFTESFVDVDYESAGADLGNYGFNIIHLDDRLYTANQITTLIHELAHHLLSEIFEQAVMIILNTDKTDAIEAYVGFTLMCSDMFLLLNEYCAHRVEGRFTPHGYQNYGSFENVLRRFDLEKDEDMIKGCMEVGNTFCQDILNIIEPFIDYNLREEIKQQFKKDFNYPPNYHGIYLEIKETVNYYHLLEFINVHLLSGFVEALDKPELLDDYWKEFEFHNKGFR